MTDLNATTQRKLEGFDFYRSVLNSPKYIVAPMVDHSEYAWRVLSRRYNSQLCYTPMFHARLFAESETYRRTQFTTGPEDRPLIVQFCANDPETLLKAAKHVENDCDAVDINLGCPQGIARKGHYGSFLMDEWDRVCDMVKILHENLNVPVTCKIRVFPEVSKTIEYAKRLQAAGCQILTVHGRTREMKGHKTGIADWEQIRAVKAALDIPVFANGNICYFEDVEACLKATGCDGVMTAEGNLYNPALFTGELPPCWKMAEEYMQICKEYPNSADIGPIRAHLFKIFAPCLTEHADLRTDLAAKHTFEDLWEITQELKRRLLAATNNAQKYDPPAVWELDSRGLRILPTWICQPHFRPELPQDSGAPPSQTNEGASTSESGVLDEVAQARIRRKEAKLNIVASKKAKKSLGKLPVCASAACLNVGSTKCAFSCCKTCCRAKAVNERISVAQNDTAVDRKGGESVSESRAAEFACQVHRTLVYRDESG
ncbi:tRNA-dihydrouridine(16/17) synthase [NAD(P)(+)]-like protein [Chytriomyces hyalinus]|nr:tRNA-dihydrouridine(16/17) synthase [NAD(P)(+)]-like protein [Chytriomyces hyalinus]